MHTIFLIVDLSTKIAGSAAKRIRHKLAGTRSHTITVHVSTEVHVSYHSGTQKAHIKKATKFSCFPNNFIFDFCVRTKSAITKVRQ